MIKLLFMPRMWTMILLGFASGLPLALTGSTLQAWFTTEGSSVVTVGILSLVGMPYVWKFLWAPLMDRYRVPVAGRRRGWIMLAQLGLCGLLWVIADVHPSQTPGWVGIIAVLIAFLSASQDIAVDAYRTELLPADERGLGVACFVFSYRLAMLVSGGLALILADYYGWKFTYHTMALLIGLAAVVTYFLPPVAHEDRNPSQMRLITLIKNAFNHLFQQEAMLLILLFVVVYRLGDALTASLMSNFLMRGLGFSLSEIGVAYKTVSLVSMVLGAFLAGNLLVKWGLYRSLMIFGVMQALSILMLSGLAWVGKNYVLMVSVIFIENFCNGMGTAAFIAFLMSLCHEQYTATQYACLTALAAVGRVLIGPVAGYMVADVGWVGFYGWASMLCLPGLFILFILRYRIGFSYAKA